MNASKIRAQFLQFFQQKDHTILPSSSLIPEGDPSLLFINAGMVPFKQRFLGQSDLKRAASVQRCLRVGGKHNDLENVGHTARHHTFFEMLGNFSFGDYFKKTAIHHCWELLTTIYRLPEERLWVTVFAEDDEAYNIWRHTIGIPENRLVRIGFDGQHCDNFWQMADVGPCGPCSEVFYDHGPNFKGGPPGSADADGDRYIEIWNLVFMQFDRGQDGVLKPLPSPCIDTGMGLERIAAVLQGVHSNYDSDIFQSLIAAAAKITGQKNHDQTALKVLADHIRAISFLIADGIHPHSDGRAYVLRRIIRRAIRYGYQLGQRNAFLYQLVPALVESMGAAYPIILQKQEDIVTVLQEEELRFFETLASGMQILNTEFSRLAANNGQRLSGQLAFKLHDTYGFPLDLTENICAEAGVKVALEDFDSAMRAQQEQARAQQQFKQRMVIDTPPTRFFGYEDFDIVAKVNALYRDNECVKTLSSGESGSVILDQTSFYAESGGQVGDVGQLLGDHVHFKVCDTQKTPEGVWIHYGHVESGTINVAENVRVQVDREHRRAVMRNHSATHLLHYVLRQQLGPHVQQKGSLVDAQKLRFDFSHAKSLSPETLASIEQQVNAIIFANNKTETRWMAFQDAVNEGAIALFGEKYQQSVRVMDIGPSRELCGGTHVAATAEIALFKIVSETGIAAGVRRIEAITGGQVLSHLQNITEERSQAAEILQTSSAQLLLSLKKWQEKMQDMKRQLQNFRLQLVSHYSQQLLTKNLQTITPGVDLLSEVLKGADAELSRLVLDRVRDRAALIILLSLQEKNAHLLIYTHHKIQWSANAILQQMLRDLGGSGGGKAQLAQGNILYPEKWPQALRNLVTWLQK